MFCVEMGYGRNNDYLANYVLKASQVLKYETAAEDASVIQDLIIPVAEAGEFDDGLSATLEKHREAAEERRVKEAANRKAFEVKTQVSEPAAPAMAAE